MIPPQDQAITTQHATRVAAYRQQLNAKIINLTDQQVAIDLAIVANATDKAALKEKMKVEDILAKANFDLTEDLEVFLTMDEKAEHSNVYHTHC